MTTIEKYEKSVMQVIDEFCKKYDCTFDGWIGGIVGEVCEFGNYTFNFTDIYLDLKQNAPLGLIFEWQNADIEFNIDRKKPKHINYRSYMMGARFNKDTKKATFEWLFKKGYIYENGQTKTDIDNLRIFSDDKKNIELRFAFDNEKECNVIYNPTKKQVKKAVHLFSNSVITEL